MMLPLCTRVTLRRWFASAQRMAARTRRCVPSREMGLTPIRRTVGEADAWRILPGNVRCSSCHEVLIRRGVPSSNSMPGVQVFGVLAEDDHVHPFGVAHRGGHTLEPAHRAQADVQVQVAAQGHVQRAHAAAHRGGQRTFDAHQVGLESLQGFIRQPGAGLFKGSLPGEDLQPGNRTAAAHRPLHSRVQHLARRLPDFRPNAISVDERDDRAIGHAQLPVLEGYFFRNRGHAPDFTLE